MSEMEQYLGVYAIYTLLIVIQIIIQRSLATNRKRKAGNNLRIFPLENKNTKIFKRVKLFLIPVLALSGIFVMMMEDSVYDMIKEGLKFAIFIFAIQTFSFSYVNIVCGDNGIFIPGFRFIKWSDIEEINWDKDIGQTQWGLNLNTKGSRKNYRLFVFPDTKDRMSPIFEHYFGA